MRGVFITATGTGVGKTWFACALARALIERRQRVAAIKPIETGCEPNPRDAMALADVCEDRALANAPGLYRARPPLAPYAIAKGGGPSVGSLDVLASRVRGLAQGADWCVVEGAGGVLVPIDAERTFADLASSLGFPAIVLAPNALGVLSHTLTALESLHRRNVPVLAVVLNQVMRNDDDLSTRSNLEVLADCLPSIEIFATPLVSAPEELVSAISPLVDSLMSG